MQPLNKFHSNVGIINDLLDGGAFGDAKATLPGSLEYVVKQSLNDLKAKYEELIKPTLVHAKIREEESEHIENITKKALEILQKNNERSKNLLSSLQSARLAMNTSQDDDPQVKTELLNQFRSIANAWNSHKSTLQAKLQNILASKFVPKPPIEKVHYSKEQLEGDREKFADSTPLSRNLDLFNDDRTPSQAAFGHLHRRMQILKQVFNVCQENRRDLSQYQIDQKYKAHLIYKCNEPIQRKAYRKYDRNDLLKEQKQIKGPIPKHEYAHTSLIPQVNIYKDQKVWELNPPVEIEQMIGFGSGVVSLNQLLNCTDYAPWYINVIDDYVETHLRPLVSAIMSDVISKKYTSEQAYVKLLGKFECTLTQLRDDLIRGKESKNQKSNRFQELLDGWNDVDLAPQIKDALNGMFSVLKQLKQLSS